VVVINAWQVDKVFNKVHIGVEQNTYTSYERLNEEYYFVKIIIHSFYNIIA